MTRPPTGDNSIYNLFVEGGIATRDVRVTSSSPWPDFVFKKNYDLLSLTQLEKYIEENNHLPELPSASEIEENKGFEIGGLQTKLVQKVEEQTLYIISLQKQIDELKRVVHEFKN